MKQYKNHNTTGFKESIQHMAKKLGYKIEYKREYPYYDQDKKYQVILCDFSW